MKKMLFCAAAAIVVLASCSKTHVVYNDAPQEIAFKQITSAMTKAAPTTSDLTNSSGNLGVFAFDQSNDVYFGNTQFTYADNVWSANKYWPVSGNLSFMLYYPYNATSNTVTADMTNSKLTISVDNSTTQTDWLYASKLHTESKPSDGTAISVVMKHALAQITVNLKADIDDIVTITDFEVTGTYQKGTLTVTQSTTENTTSWEKTETQSWDLTTLVDNTNKLSTTAKTATCLVIPDLQTTFVMNYKLDGVDAEQTYTHKFNPDNLTAQNGAPTWDAAKNYIYNITIGVTEIKFDCDVEDMTDSPDSQGNDLEWTAEVNN